MSSLYGVKPGQKLGPDFRFEDGSYSSFYKLDINFLNLPVYRAETKTEFLFDALFLAGSVATGGWQSGVKFGLSKLDRD